MNTIKVQLKSSSPMPVKVAQCGNTINVESDSSYDYKILHGEIVAETDRAKDAEENLQQQINGKQDLGYIKLDDYLLNPDIGEISNKYELNRLNTYLVNKVMINSDLFYLSLSNDNLLVYFCSSPIDSYNEVRLERNTGIFRLIKVEVGTTYHNELHNLDWSNSGHTGFAGIEINTTQYWNSIGRTYRPDKGMIIVYTDYLNGKPAIKVGNGNVYLTDLPFVDEGIQDILQEHIVDNVVHITQEEREFWNNKINLVDTPVGDLLTFNRN